jgi:formylglycine-generating enzyme
MKKTLLAILLVAMSGLPDSSADTFGGGANAFEITFETIGNPGNAPDTNGRGQVAEDFRISTLEISSDQVAKAVAGGLANVSAEAWTGERPAAFATWYEAAAFINFLNTDRGFAEAYDLTWTGEAWTMALWSVEESWSSGTLNRYRHKDAFYFMPSEDEWYKAAYHKGAGGGYWAYPTASDTAPTAVASGTASSTAVFDEQTAPANVGLSGGTGPYGTRGQGGNIAEWLESAWDGVNDNPAENRVVRGGDWFGAASDLESSFRAINAPEFESDLLGFRVASIPEPSTVSLIAIACLAAAAALRRRR